ncbi:uncharacterized protein LOC143920369 [Arctopsyche grandis]|uniref:uncharacterized protein LOC143920369 n=1 Tax=Arctopsyche grandis TaxID=121162 RepID=UPI00406D9BE2
MTSFSLSVKLLFVFTTLVRNLLIKLQISIVNDSFNNIFHATNMGMEDNDLSREKSVTNVFNLSKHFAEGNLKNVLTKPNLQKNEGRKADENSNNFPVSDFRVKSDSKIQKINIKIVLTFSSKYISSFEKYYKKHVEIESTSPENDDVQLNPYIVYRDDEFIQCTKDFLENELSFASAITECMKSYRKIYKLYFKKNMLKINQEKNEESHYFSPPNYYLLKDSNWRPTGNENSNWKYIHDVRCKCLKWMTNSNKYLQ